MEFHPLANIFPLMSDGELEILAADIAAHGLREPIHTYQGRILDGRNRFNACRKANRQPRFLAWDGEGDPVAFVVSMNMHRRHLDESQRALVAGKLAEMKRGEHTLPRGVRTEKTLENQDISNGPIGPFAPTSDSAVTIPQAAELLSVGQRSVKRARHVLKHGHETLVAAVEAGQLSINDAAKVAKQPKSIQQTAVEAVKNGRARTAAQVVERIQPRPLPPEAVTDTTDAFGSPLPDAYLAVFATRCEFQAAGRKLDEARRAVEELAESPAGFYLRKELQHLAGKFKEIKYVVTHTAPYAVAPAKRNEPKWVSEIVWRTLSDEERRR